ncbi:hypothetical protein QUF63_06285 [Anaerolineales bacterium HSG25]|nr:hypothetical protein [Anaerolineales bacterium HSG25]
MSYLPTIFLILAAGCIGATVIAIMLARRARREARATIFPIVYEEEMARVKWATMTGVFFTGMAVLFFGGWMMELTNPFPTLSLPTSDIAATETEPVTESVQVMRVDEATDTESPLAEPDTVPENNTNNDEPAVVEVVPTTVDIAPTEEPASPTVPPSATPVPATPTPSNTSTPQPSATRVEVVLTTTTESRTVTTTPSAVAVKVVVVTVDPAEIESLLAGIAVPTTLVIGEATTTPTVNSTVTNAPTATAEATTASSTIEPATPPALTDAVLGPITFTSNTNTAVSTRSQSTFSDTVQRVYARFPFKGMQNGVTFTAVWYRDEQELWRDEHDWEWGEAADSYTFVNIRGLGTYRLDLYVDGSMLVSNSFQVE